MLPKLFVSRHISEKYVIFAAITFISVGILIRVYKGRDEPIRAMWLDSERCKCISQSMAYAFPMTQVQFSAHWHS